MPDVQAGFRKGRWTRDQIANICWITEKARDLQKNTYFSFVDSLKPLTLFSSVAQLCPTLCNPMNYSTQGLCGSHQIVENSSRDGNTRPPYLPPEKSVCRSESNTYTWTWNNRLVPNWKRFTSWLYIVTLLFSCICRVHRVKCQAGWSTSWNQGCQEKYQ